MSAVSRIYRRGQVLTWEEQAPYLSGDSSVGGYHGTYLVADLTARRVSSRTLEPDELRAFLGGAGLAAYLLLRHVPPGVDPLGPTNALIVSFSPLVGSPFTTTAKFCVASKSPLTERCCDALCSSAFALAGKRSGYDAIVVTGAADSPAVLVVEDGEVRLDQADDLWGRSAAETAQLLKERYPGYESLFIGPAGEHLVRYATVQHDGRHAGRGGLGAVMGSKRLKAIVVRGERRVSVADARGAGRFARELAERSLGPSTAKYRLLGTVANVALLHRIGALPSRNFRSVQFPELAAFTAENLEEGGRRERKSCAACTIGCEHRFVDAAGSVRLEYETVYAFGAACGVTDRATLLQAARLCDELGLDTISAGVTIAFAMECAERGWLKDRRLFERPEKLIPGLLEAVAFRRDTLGDSLAEGVRRLAARIGGEAESIAPHVKGLEMPGYEPRAMQAMALGLAVAARGADHNRSSAYEVDLMPDRDRLSPDEGTVQAVIEREDRSALMDSLILCKFLRHALRDFYADCRGMISLITGWDVSEHELKLVGARVVTLRRLFNIREGGGAEEDILPDRFFREPLQEGPVAGAVLDRQRFLELRSVYYRLRGWTRDGCPSAEALTRLGLDRFLVSTTSP